MTFVSCLNYMFHTCSWPHNIVSHTWAQTPQWSRCYHHPGCGRHPGFPWGSLRRGHTAGRTSCGRKIQGLEAWNKCSRKAQPQTREDEERITRAAQVLQFEGWKQNLVGWHFSFLFCFFNQTRCYWKQGPLQLLLEFFCFFFQWHRV